MQAYFHLFYVTTFHPETNIFFENVHNHVLSRLDDSLYASGSFLLGLRLLSSVIILVVVRHCRQQERQPAYGEHPQCRILRSVRVVQRGSVGGATGVPRGPSAPAGKGSSDATQRQSFG